MQTSMFDFPPRPPNIDSDSRYTLPDTLRWCCERAGVDGWDLDVAACAEAHCAPRYYTHADNGLALPWTGRAWCNPPWSACGLWVGKAWQEFEAGGARVIGMLLPGDRQEQQWWQELVEQERDGRGRGVLATHYLPGRTRYGSPGDLAGVPAGSPNFNSVLLTWRSAK